VSDVATRELGSLLDGIRAGDERASVALVNRYEPMLRRVLRVTGVINWLQSQQDSQDLVQSVFMQVVSDLRQGKGEFSDEAKFEAYLRTLGRSRLRDQIRRLRAAKRNRARTMDGEAGNLSSVASSEPSPSRLVELQDQVAQVEACVPGEDFVLLQDRADGMGWDELASARGLSPDALRKRVERVRRRIRETLAASGSQVVNVD
jgi:RNA polymerase sigma factor (sigma-70 family)